ncbi:MAG: ATP-binding protein [Lentisphaeria bacterium]|nr:ATP-binding protein [Lentisphaeria bacterium]
MNNKKASSHKAQLNILLFSLLTLALLGFLSFNTYRLNRVTQETGMTDEYLMKCNKAGDLLRTGSDILTNAVRNYVVSGNIMHREAYFKEAYTDKHRESGIKEASRLPNGEKLEKILVDGMKHSIDLMMLEYHAMRLISTEQDLSDPACPAEVREYVLTEEEKKASPEVRREIAIGIVFGQEYSHFKEMIYSSIDRNLGNAIQFFSSQRKDVFERYHRFYMYQIIALICFIPTLLLFTLFLLRQRGRANKFLRLVLDNIPIMFFIKDARTERYVDCNSAFSKFAGKDSVADTIGYSDDELFDESTAKDFVAKDRKALSGKEPNSYLENALDAHGKAYSFLTTKLRITDMEGNTCLFGMSQDVTEAMETHRNSEAIGEALLVLQSYDAVSHPQKVIEIIRRRLAADFVHLIRCDEKLDQAIVEPDCHAHRVPEAPNERLVADLDDFRFYTKSIKPLEPFTIDGNAPQALLHTYGCFDPENRTWNTSVSYSMPVLRAGKVFGSIVIGYAKKRILSEIEKEFIQMSVKVLENALERKRANDELRNALDKEIEAERAKSYFFSSVSHDIRTPLNAIIGYTELLIGGIDDEQERAKALSAISTSGNTLLQLINDVLDLSKLESGKMDIKPELTDVRELASSVLHSFDVTTMNRGIELKEEYDFLPLLEVDPQRIRQILFNLIGNAVKFTEQGEIRVKASFKNNISNENGILTISVSDTGCGIADGEKDKLMTPYVQAGSKSKTKGTGLGLAICKQLATRMGGSLSFVSQLGKGSTFTLELHEVKSAAPVPESDKKADDAKKQLLAEMDTDDTRNGIKICRAQTDTKTSRVLIADDVPLNLAVLKALLTRIGIRDIVTAVNGLDAWQKIQASDKPFDLVLTDMWMPKMDGKDLVAKIREDSRFVNLPVYAITADIEEKKSFEEHGFTGLLLKPVTIVKLSRLFKASHTTWADTAF